MDNIISYLKELKELRLSDVTNYGKLFNQKFNNGIKFLLNKNFNTFIDDENGLNKLNNDFIN